MSGSDPVLIPPLTITAQPGNYSDQLSVLCLGLFWRLECVTDIRERNVWAIGRPFGARTPQPFEPKFRNSRAPLLGARNGQTSSDLTGRTSGLAKAVMKIYAVIPEKTLRLGHSCWNIPTRIHPGEGTRPSRELGRAVGTPRSQSSEQTPSTTKELPSKGHFRTVWVISTIRPLLVNLARCECHSSQAQSSSDRGHLHHRGAFTGSGGPKLRVRWA